MKRILVWCAVNIAVGTLVAVGHAPATARVVSVMPVAPTTTSSTSVVETTTTTSTMVVEVPTTEVPVTTTSTTVAAPVVEAIPPAEAPSLEGAYAEAVPAVWRSVISLYVEIIPGNTSWSDPRKGIKVSQRHANRSHGELLFTIAHEFGHQLAYLYGPHHYGGDPPEGWPGQADPEAWADCVGQAFTGHRFGNRCSADSLAFTQDWLATGPASHKLFR